MKIRLVTGAAVAASAALLTSAAPAMASPATPSHVSTSQPHVVKHEVSVAEQNKARAFWSIEKIRSAKPLPTLRKVRTSSRGTLHRGKPHLVPGSPPQQGTGRPPNDVAGPMYYPIPYYSFTVPNSAYMTWPYRLNGRIFFVAPNGGLYWCSGTSIVSPQGNEVWTSGQCLGNYNLSSPGRWNLLAIFVPGYNFAALNPAPFGFFVMQCMVLWSPFFFGGDMNLDYGAMHVGVSVGVSPFAGMSLAAAVGTDGFAWNWPTTQEYVSFGYPGANMVEDRSVSLAGTNVTWFPFFFDPPMFGMGNPQNPLLGSNGGAWNLFWSPFFGGYLNGNNALKVPGQPLSTYSPYMNTAANFLRVFPT